MGMFVCMKKWKRNLRLVLMWWIFPKTFQPCWCPSGFPFGSSAPLVYSGVHYRACIPQAWPPSCPLGLHLGLIGSCCCRKPWFTRAERQASDVQLCVGRKGKLCITRCVFYGGESRPGELDSTESDSMIDRCQGGVWHELKCDISHSFQQKFFSINRIKTKQMMPLRISIDESNCSFWTLI